MTVENVRRDLVVEVGITQLVRLALNRNQGQTFWVNRSADADGKHVNIDIILRWGGNR